MSQVAEPRCACVRESPYQCIRVRSNNPPDDVVSVDTERCECGCHDGYNYYDSWEEFGG